MKSKPKLSFPITLGLIALALGGCATTAKVGEPGNQLVAAGAADQINWPEQYRPEDADFYVRNEIEIAAPAEAIWNELVNAKLWSSYYEGAKNVQVENSDGVLKADSRFTWNTMGLDFVSVIHEFEPPYRLSWESSKSSIQGYHAWLIIPNESGATLITEESQHGWLTFFQKMFVPNKLRRLHDDWLLQIKQRAESSGEPN